MKKLLLAFALSLVPFIDVTAQPSSQTALSSRSEPSLISPETKVDYRRLQSLLTQQNWREANNETFNLMLRAAKRERQGWLTTGSVQELACWDLAKIDKLWTASSQGRFGFSPQFQIFVETGNRPGRLVSIEKYQEFGDRVGWRTNNDWIIFKENLNFTLEAPVGHLPAPRQEYQISGGRLEYTTLAQRMIDCQVISLPNLQRQQ